MSTKVLPDKERAIVHAMPGAPGLATLLDVTCAHCGLNVPAALQSALAEPQFCCNGCETVYAILHQTGMEAYYALPQRHEVPAQVSNRNYEEFDHPAFSDLYVQTSAAGHSRTELYLEHVHCASCVWLVERIPLLLPGVARAELNVRRSLAVVEWDNAALPLSEIAQMLDRLGYASHPYRGVSRDAMRQRESRAMLARIGVAGAIAINVMLAALALYSGERNGMERKYQQFFRTVSLLLTIPAFIWPGRVFFTGALSALRTRSLHMDVPIAIALAAGLVRGAINTVTNSGPVYFDGLAILIFALLVGRFLQQRGQRLAADSAELLYALAPASARIVEGMTLREVPTAALLPGMVLDVRAGECFAADGTVATGSSSINAALLTGESRPTRVHVGDTVYSGTMNVEAPLRVVVTNAGEFSRIAKLLQQVEESAQRRAPVVLLANRLAGVFVAVVLVAAVLTFAIKWQLAPERALDDAIALLIVTCPCALALATPLAITVAIGRAARTGILVKGGDALELLAEPGTLILDKTGTLTEGTTTLVSWAGPVGVQSLVHALEVGSSHPLADGFRRAWGTTSARVAVDTHHVVGCGLEGMVDTTHVRVGSPRWVTAHAAPLSTEMEVALGTLDHTLTPVLVAVDHQVVACAGLGDAIRIDALTSLQKLRSMGWQTVMLSGDSTHVALSVGTALQFADSQIFAEQSPEHKLSFVQARMQRGQRVVMVGDGVNDAAAIAAATVGIGVHGGAEACLANADVYLTRPGLSTLVELIEGTLRTKRVIVRNIAFSIAYNLVGASLAVGGLLTPLIAAILMPTSSITVVLSSWASRTFSNTRTGRA